jgi:hypothetical protein
VYLRKNQYYPQPRVNNHTNSNDVLTFLDLKDLKSSL